MNGPYTYQLAVSFAGEDRELARFIAASLAPDFSVFLDEFERAELWGADLTEALPLRYRASRFCLILQSEEYLEKIWTTLERQAIIHEFLVRRGKDYILPLRVRGCQKTIPGLSEVVGHITVRSNTEWPGIVDLIKRKLLTP